MEPFLRKRLAFLSFFWDKIWRTDLQAGDPGQAPVPAADPGPDPGRIPDPGPVPDPGPATQPAPPAGARLFRALHDFTARCADELSVSRGDRLFALREDRDYILARRLSGPPSAGLVPVSHVAKAASEALPDRP